MTSLVILLAKKIIIPSQLDMTNIFMMHMIFGLELKANLISPNMIVHFVLLLPESSLLGFGGLDDNPIKGLTSVLSVEQVLNAKLTGFNTSEQV